MLDKKGFDMWADEYDIDVEILNNENSYPFAGYKSVLSRILAIVSEKINRLFSTLDSEPESSQKSSTKMAAQSTVKTFPEKWLKLQKKKCRMQNFLKEIFQTA